MSVEERLKKTIDVLKCVQPYNYDAMVRLVACVNELENILREGAAKKDG